MNFINSLKGYKTYILAGALLAYAIGGLITGHLTLTAFVILLSGSGFSTTLRAAIGKIEEYLPYLLDAATTVQTVSEVIKKDVPDVTTSTETTVKIQTPANPTDQPGV